MGKSRRVVENSIHNHITLYTSMTFLKNKEKILKGKTTFRELED